MAEAQAARTLMAVLELLRASRDRTYARRQFRGACETAAQALTAHLRVGDHAQVGEACYQIERVTWRTADDPEQAHPGPSTSALIRGQHVLHDVRAGSRRDRHPPIGLQFGRASSHGEIVWDLRLAPDPVLQTFAKELPEVIVAFERDIRADAAALRESTETLLTNLLGWEKLTEGTSTQRPRRR